jgi:hypothetical protein
MTRTLSLGHHTGAQALNRQRLEIRDTPAGNVISAHSVSPGIRLDHMAVGD